MGIVENIASTSEKPSAFLSKPVGLQFRKTFKYATVNKWLYFSAAKKWLLL